MHSIQTYLYQLKAEDIQQVEANYGLYVTSAEWERNQRMKHAQSRQTALLGRVLLRRKLAELVHCSPVDVPISVAATGKPECVHGGEPLHFNLSHSGECVLLAIGRSSAVGVDIEWAKPRTHSEQLAEYIMHADEYRRFQTLSAEDAEAFFYQTWVLKEAYAKCDGRGIQLGLRKISTRLEPPGVVGAGVTGTFLQVPLGYYAALISANLGRAVEVGQHRVQSVCDCESEPYGSAVLPN